MSNTIIRAATIRDVPEVAGLFDAYRQFYGRPADLPLAESFIRQRIGNHESIMLVAENKGIINGFCQLYPTFCSVSAASIYILYDLYVAPHVRKSGTGRALLLFAEQLAVKNGISRIDLSTARTNYVAQLLYESLGWKRDELFLTYSKSMP